MSSFLGGGGSGSLPPAGSNRVWYVDIIYNGTIVGGSGYPGFAVFPNVALTGGSGTGARAGIGANGGAIVKVAPTVKGTGYIVGDVLSAASGDIGGGSGFTFTITAIGLGNDSNDGLTSSTPFLTIQHAVLVAAMFDYQALYNPTINVAAGLFLELPGHLTLPELLNPGNGSGGTINGAGYTLTTIQGNNLNTGAQAAIEGYGSFSIWFFNNLTVDSSRLVGVQSGTDAFMQYGNCGFVDSTGLALNIMQAAGGTVAIVNTTMHILSSVAIFGGSNNTSTTNAWGDSTIEVVNSTINLPAGTYGTAWWRYLGVPSNLIYTGNTVVNAGNFTGAQISSIAALVTSKSDNGLPSDFPGDPTLNVIGSGTFFNSTLNTASSQGMVPNISDPAYGCFSVSKDSGQTTPGKGIFVNTNDAGTIKTLTPDTAHAATQFDITNNTLADIPGMTVIVTDGVDYQFNAVLFTTSNIAAGVQAAVGGTCTATNIIYEGETTSAAAIGAQTRATALATSVGAVTAVTAARIDIMGHINTATPGTLTIKFAQNVGNAAASSVLIGSYMSVQQLG